LGLIHRLKEKTKEGEEERKRREDPNCFDLTLVRKKEGGKNAETSPCKPQPHFYRGEEGKEGEEGEGVLDHIVGPIRKRGD